MYAAYRTFRENRKQGENFITVLCCTSGNHHSVAMAVLLENLFLTIFEAAGEHDVSVETVHCCQEMGLWEEFCLGCKNCKDSDAKRDWLKKKAMILAHEVV